jgi:tetratricopeptide (TPR) repeat protein
VSVGLVATLVLAPTSARAASPSAEAAAEARRGEAKSKFEAGVAAFGEHRYADAVQAFLQADALAPSAALSFNIARAFEHLNNPAAALRWYRDYLRRNPQATNLVEVQARVSEHAAELAARGVQQLTVLSTPDGAALSVDERAVGPTPITFELAPGRHRLSVRLPGYAEQSADVVVDLHTPEDVTLRLTPARSSPAPVAAADATRPAQATPANHRTSPSAGERRFGPVAPWIVVGAGAASLLGAVGFELARRSAESAAESAPQLEYQDHFDAMHGRQTAARVLLAVGGAVLVTGSVMVVLNTPRPVAQLALGCNGAGCGVAALGSFE